MEKTPEPPADRHRLLGIYLDDHFAGASAGLARFQRAARSHRGSDAAAVLTRLAGEVADDRDALLRTMRTLGFRPDRRLQLLARAAEAAGALKTNGRVLRRSPLSSVVELEALELGVRGKGALWRSLRELALHDARLDADRLQELVERADRQAAELETLRRSAVAEALGTGHRAGPTVVPPHAG